MVRHLLRKKDYCKEDLEELEYLGNLGLIDAAHSFDYKTGYCFYTYARGIIVQRFSKFKRERRLAHLSDAIGDEKRTLLDLIEDESAKKNILDCEFDITLELSSKSVNAKNMQLLTERIEKGTDYKTLGRKLGLSRETVRLRVNSALSKIEATMKEETNINH